MAKGTNEELMSSFKEEIIKCVSDAIVKASENKEKKEDSSESDSLFKMDVIERLARIEEQLKADYKALHGNGKKGLIDRVSKLENSFYAGGMIYRVLVGIVAWVITTAVAIYAAVKN